MLSVERGQFTLKYRTYCIPNICAESLCTSSVISITLWLSLGCLSVEINQSDRLFHFPQIFSLMAFSLKSWISEFGWELPTHSQYPSPIPHLPFAGTIS